MLKLLDDLTDLRNYPRPKHPEFVTQVRAKHDLYVPKGYDLREHWPGSEVREFTGGHISSVAINFLPKVRALFSYRALLVDFAKFDMFNTAIIDSFDKLDKFREREGLERGGAYPINSMY